MKLNSLTIKLALSALMLAAGTGLVLTASKSPKVSAQTDSVTTTWTATGFMNVSGHAEDGGPRLGPVTIGVTKWHNETRQGGVLLYDEDWTADLPANPAVDTFSFHTNGGRTPIVQLPTGYDKNRFMSSWIYASGNTNMRLDVPTTISFSNVRQAERVMNEVGRQNFSAIGNAVHCMSDGNYECIAATGSYGFGTWDNMGDGIGNFPTGFGALIPTKWTVVGTFR